MSACACHPIKSTTLPGGAIFVDTGAVVEFYDCRFDSIQAANATGCNNGWGGALFFEAGSNGVFVGGTICNNRGTLGGAIATNANPESTEPMYSANVTISGTAFANNHAYIGDDIYVILADDGKGKVPCPAPGCACDSSQGGSRCCIDGDHDNLDYVVPNA